MFYFWVRDVDNAYIRYRCSTEVLKMWVGGAFKNKMDETSNKKLLKKEKEE